MKKLAILLFLAFMLIGCSDEEEKITNDLKSKVNDKYSVVIFVDEEPSDSFQQNINHTLMDSDGQ